jgi:hypothetical protein
VKTLSQLLSETRHEKVQEQTPPVSMVEATDVITPDQLYHDFDVDGDGVVSVDDYASKILWHETHPGKLEWIMGNMDGVHLEHAASEDSSCAVSLHEDYDRRVETENLDENTKGSLMPPSMIVMKRVAIRQYPNGQKVALYYAKTINKYLTVPYNDIGIADLTKE